MRAFRSRLERDRAKRIHVRGVTGRAYCGRVGSFAPMFDSAAAMPKPVMRDAVGRQHDVAQVQQAVVHAPPAA